MAALRCSALNPDGPGADPFLAESGRKMVGHLLDTWPHLPDIGLVVLGQAIGEQRLDSPCVLPQVSQLSSPSRVSLLLTQLVIGSFLP